LPVYPEFVDRVAQRGGLLGERLMELSSFVPERTN